MNENAKYLCIAENTKTCDSWEWIFDTADEANKAADDLWFHLTAREKLVHHVYAVIVRREHLTDDAIDEETGDIDWLMFHSAGTFPGAFDSEALGQN